MNYVYTLLIGFAVGFGVAWMVKKNKVAPVGKASPSVGEAAGSYYNEADRKKDENLATIMALFDGAETITNEVVTAKLGVANSTAENYCDELEKSGKIIQVGRTGKFVTYKRA